MNLEDIMLTPVFSVCSFFHVMPGFDVWPVLPHSLHGKFLHHSRCGSSKAQEQKTKTKESVIENNKNKSSVHEKLYQCCFSNQS